MNLWFGLFVTSPAQSQGTLPSPGFSLPSRIPSSVEYFIKQFQSASSWRGTKPSALYKRCSIYIMNQLSLFIHNYHSPLTNNLTVPSTDGFVPRHDVQATSSITSLIISISQQSQTSYSSQFRLSNKSVHAVRVIRVLLSLAYNQQHINHYGVYRLLQSARR